MSLFAHSLHNLTNDCIYSHIYLHWRPNVKYSEKMLSFQNPVSIGETAMLAGSMQRCDVIANHCFI